MKATFLITGLGLGGAEQFLSRLLPLEGVDVISITGLNTLGKQFEKKGIHVTYLNPDKKVRIISSAIKLYKHLKRNKTTTLMTFLIHADIFGRFIGFIARVNVICNIRNDYRKITWLWKVDRMTRFLVHKYIVNNSSLDEYMRRIKVKKYEVIPNGVDVNTLNNEAKQGFKQKQGIKKKVITCVARLEKQKNHYTLLKAMTFLDGYTLVLVGEGSQKNHLVQFAQSLGISHNVKFLGARKDIPSILKETDCFVLPSYTEGMSNALLEAMAMGIPCVVSAIRQNKVLINKCGLTFDMNNPEDLAEKITHAKKELGILAKKHIIENYDINIIRKKYEAVL